MKDGERNSESEGLDWGSQKGKSGEEWGVVRNWGAVRSLGVATLNPDVYS